MNYVKPHVYVQGHQHVEENEKVGLRSYIYMVLQTVTMAGKMYPIGFGLVCVMSLSVSLVACARTMTRASWQLMVPPVQNPRGGN